MIKINIYQRIALTALMMIMYVIATRLCKVAITGFVRLSAGPAILIFSSILLGPISGALVGGCGDVFGSLLFPYLGMAINPFMSISYIVMGIVPGLLMIIFKKFHNSEKVSKIIYITFLFLIWLAILIFSIIANEIEMFNNVYSLNLTARILIPLISFVLMGLILLFTYFLDNRFKIKRKEYPNLPSVFYIAFIVMFIEVFFTLLLNPMIRALYYAMPFEVIFFTSLLLAFIYVPGNTIIVAYLSLLALKVIKIRE